MQNKEKLLEVSHVSKVFPVKKQQLRAVSDVSFSISRGEILGIVGESGCGKSTLAKILVGSLPVSEGKMILNGPQGAVSISKISTFTAGILLILFSLFVVLNLVNSKTGRAVTAIRDNRIAAESVGINITKYKLTAFIISAIIAGMAGALYAMNFSTIAAIKFDFNTSILILVFVVLGGMGNIPGTIIATTLLYMLPELLRQFSDYRMLIYAIVLIVVMLATNSPRMKMYKDKITAVFKRNKNMDREGDVSNG